MPAKIKTIPASLDEELRELEIDLLDCRPVVICPLCIELREEIPAIQCEDVKYHYYCGNCNHRFALQ